MSNSRFVSWCPVVILAASLLAAAPGQAQTNPPANDGKGFLILLRALFK